MVQDRATYNDRLIKSRIWSIERAILNDLEQPLTEFSRSRHCLALSMSEMVRYTNMFYNEILIGT